MNWKALQLSGWGRSSQGQVLACRPERIAELRAVMLEKAEGGILAHGNGRSYGDAAINDQGRVVLTNRLNRMLAFNDTSLELVCEPGVTFNDILYAFAERGLFAPVTPGTGFATIAGAIANDVHGKNHDKSGSLGDHVVWIDLLLANGEIRRISQTQDPDLFFATIGGLGLTGIIMQVCLRLQHSAPEVELKEQRMNDLESFLQALAASRDKANFSVGWIDASAKGANMGRGILETAEYLPINGKSLETNKVSKIPFNLPGKLLNPLTVSLFNNFYYRRIPNGGRMRTVALDKFLYPLDTIHHWNRLYGKKGFYQFQCVIPDAQAAQGMRQLLETISKQGAASFLSVIKTLGSEGQGYLSFCQRGYTLALDFPRQTKNTELLQQLEKITLDHDGRIYLAKDALLSAQGFRQMYPKLKQFQTVLNRVDPERKMQSDLARRLQIREELQ